MRLRDQLLYKAVGAAFLFLGNLPEWLRRGCAVQLGHLLFALDRKHRRVAIQNLELAFGHEKSPAQRHAIARRVFENLFHIIFEIGWSLTLPPAKLSRYFRVSGLEDYQRASAKGKGVLFLVAHFGNWELWAIGQHLAKIPARVVYRPLDAPFLNRFFQETRTRFGTQTIPTHRGTMRRIYMELRKGHAVAMLMDQSVDWYEGVFVDFFNHRACTSTGMALLALKSEAPVVPAFMIRTTKGFHAVFGPELPLIRTGDRTKDVELNTQQYNRVIESYVRRFPDQWFWVHRRWKTRPYQPWPRTTS
jgi:Kdo2-lipid IVA lauroyltransferase/acyltransferase